MDLGRSRSGGFDECFAGVADLIDVRSPVAADVPAIIDLIAACDRYEYGRADEYSEQDVLEQFAGRAADAWLVMAADGRVAGYAFLGDRGEGQMEAEAYVHPERHGGGIGTALLRLLETRARQRTVEEPPDARVTLTIPANARNRAAEQLFAQHGYVAVRHAWRMAIEMDRPPPESVWPEGVAVRVFAPGVDERPVFDTIQEAFADVWGRAPMRFERWAEWTGQAGFDPALWFLAGAGGDIVGAVLAEQEPDSGHVVQVGVRRAWRRRGVGLALLLHTFGEFYRRGERRVFLTVDAESLTGATRLYERAGMRVALYFAKYQKVIRPGSDPRVAPAHREGQAQQGGSA